MVVGEEDAVQLAEGEALGLALGLDVVLEVGVALGVLEGETLGLAEGVPLGLAVGVWVGVAVGVDVALGEWVAVGLALGVALGLAVGVPVELAEAGPPLRQERDVHSHAHDAQTKVKKMGGATARAMGGGLGGLGEWALCFAPSGSLQTLPTVCLARPQWAGVQRTGLVGMRGRG